MKLPSYDPLRSSMQPRYPAFTDLQVQARRLRQLGFSFLEKKLEKCGKMAKLILLTLLNSST